MSRFGKELRSAFARGHGAALERLLHLNPARNPGVRDYGATFSGGEVTGSGVEMLEVLVPAAIADEAAGRYPSAAQHLQAAVRGLVSMISGTPDPREVEYVWLMGGLKQLCRELARMSVLAMKALDESASRAARAMTDVPMRPVRIDARDGKQLVLETTMVLRSAFQCCVSHRSATHSRKPTSIAIANEIFALLFRLHRLQDTASYLVTLNKVSTEGLPKSELVTLAFHLGRVHLVNDSLDQARAQLSLAYATCDRRAHPNLRLILMSLIPMRLVEGRTPSLALLRRYDLFFFEDLVHAVRVGNVGEFERAMETHRSLFVRHGVYILLERVLLRLYLNIVRQVWLFCASSRVPLDLLLAAFRFAGLRDADMDEVECLVASLIHRSQIRGYIAHEAKLLVLAKTDAFKRST